MRFLLSEYDDILGILNSMGVPRKKYSLRKKRGWVYIDLLDVESFSFFRDRKVELIENKFEEKIDYKIIVAGQSQNLLNWEEVLIAFRSWLKKKNRIMHLCQNVDNGTSAG